MQESELIELITKIKERKTESSKIEFKSAKDGCKNIKDRKRISNSYFIEVPEIETQMEGTKQILKIIAPENFLE